MSASVGVKRVSDFPAEFRDNASELTASIPSTIDGATESKISSVLSLICTPASQPSCLGQWREPTLVSTPAEVGPLTPLRIICDTLIKDASQIAPSRLKKIDPPNSCEFDGPTCSSTTIQSLSLASTEPKRIGGSNANFLLNTS